MKERPIQYPEYRVVADLVSQRDVPLPEKVLLITALDINGNRLPDYTKRRRKTPPVTSKEITDVQNQLKEFNVELDDTDPQKVQKLLKARKKEVFAYEKKRKGRKKRMIATGVLTAVIATGIPIGAEIYQSVRADKKQEEKELTLHETSAPAYTGWRVADAPGKDENYQPTTQTWTVGKEESIKMKNKNKNLDTGIELKEYKLFSDRVVPMLVVPLEKPYDKLFGAKVRKPDSGFHKEQWILKGDTVVQIIDKDTKYYVQIQKAPKDPDNPYDKRFVITLMTPKE